uniref:Uncharacterized protein LOC114324967 n=1 Tax=Diabrotica virgifera virgifera TaxID=50390 RepID=A0A6P7F0B0_DIAVI
MTNLALFLVQGSHLTFENGVIFLNSAVFCFAEASYITVCCESASHANRKIRIICYKLQEYVRPDSSSREEFFKLAYIASTLSPKLTAANFFIISRGTILGIINITTTYLLVILQFYVTNHSEIRRHHPKSIGKN